MTFRSLIITALFCVLPASAQTVEEIIAKHIQARGGSQWQAVNSIKLTGSFMGFSIPKPFTMIKAKGDKLHFDHHLGEKKMLIGSDGQKMWWINPWQGITNAAFINGQDLLANRPNADFLTPFFNYKEHGYQVAYEGIAEIEGVRGHQLKLTRGDGFEQTWIIDGDTWLEGVCVGPASDFGRPFEQMTFFDDFRRVEGLMIPFVVETTWHTRRRLMEVSAAKLNVPVEDAMFAKPMPEKMQPLAAMAGEWLVTAKMRMQPGGDWYETPAGSKISLRMGDNLLVEEARLPGFGGPMETLHHLAYDPYRKQYTMAVFNSMSKHNNLLIGKLEDGVLTLDNMDSGTAWDSRGRSFRDRVVYKDLTSDGFTADFYLSMDGGKEWFHYRTCAYKRK
ncbi:MAG: DUF1579 family protein [Acidobacteriota bacterium]|nr:DUF1579 family protein [Acidobacteriota bacterium]